MDFGLFFAYAVFACAILFLLRRKKPASEIRPVLVELTSDYYVCQERSRKFLKQCTEALQAGISIHRLSQTIEIRHKLTDLSYVAVHGYCSINRGMSAVWKTIVSIRLDQRRNMIVVNLGDYGDIFCPYTETALNSLLLEISFHLHDRLKFQKKNGFITEPNIPDLLRILNVVAENAAHVNCGEY